MDMTDRYQAMGLVEIEDAETGEIVRKTHNMIVAEGRKLILKAVFDKVGAIKGTKFKLYYETNNMELTTSGMTYDNIKNNVKGTEPIYTTEKTLKTLTYTPLKGDTVTLDNEMNENDICMKMHFKITGSNNVPITSIGLIYNDDTLFSRAVIDPLYMRANRTYIVHYTIYF